VNHRTVRTVRIVTVTVPYASLQAAYDTVGLTHDSNPAPGNFDPSGYSYSAEGLADNGVTPGSTITVNGSRVAFPAEEPGTPDAVTARGQVIDVGQSTAHLVLLGAGPSGSGTGTIRITYADGTTQDAPVNFADWYSNAAAPGTTLVVTARWNQPPSGGIGDHDVSIYGATVATDSNKTIATITLPNSASLHLFTANPQRTGCARARVSQSC
jgi:beta-glucosidase